jgi:hypothetical protein
MYTIPPAHTYTVQRRDDAGRWRRLPHMDFDELLEAENHNFYYGDDVAGGAARAGDGLWSGGPDLEAARASAHASHGQASAPSEVRLWARSHNDDIARASVYSLPSLLTKTNTRLKRPSTAQVILTTEFYDAMYGLKMRPPFTPAMLDRIPNLVQLVDTTERNWVALLLQQVNGAAWSPIPGDVIAKAVKMEAVVSATAAGWGVGTPPEDATCWRLLASAGADPRLLPIPKPLPAAMRQAFMDNWERLCAANSWVVCHPARDYQLYSKQLVRQRNAALRGSAATTGRGKHSATASRSRQLPAATNSQGGQNVSAVSAVASVARVIVPLNMAVGAGTYDDLHLSWKHTGAE